MGQRVKAQGNCVSLDCSGDVDYTSSEINESAQPSTSKALDVRNTPKPSNEIVCDLDEIYATLLFDEINCEMVDNDLIEADSYPVVN